MSLKMSDNNNNGDGEINRKTDSNLPILFANGYPTSLDKMTCEQLERFIPFLVKCSQNGKVEEIKPNWWPNVEVDYKVPFEKPKNFRKVRKIEKKEKKKHNFIIVFFHRTGSTYCEK